MKNDYKELFDKIKWADAVVIGAGAGLSTAAGIEYGGDRFQKNFPDFIKRYHLTDMYSSGFYPFESQEEKWAYWSRHIYHNRYGFGPAELYRKLYETVKKKNYFVLTTNADHQFFMTGFYEDRIFATQGDYGNWQCSFPCHDTLYDNESTVMKMLEEQEDCKIPSALVPKCPRCGENMAMHLRADDTFVENKDWEAAHDRYQKFITGNQDKKILFLELGVGMNTPGIIKYPFLRMTYQLEDAYYICLTKGGSYQPMEIKDKSLVWDVDIAEVFEDVKLVKQAG